MAEFRVLFVDDDEGNYNALSFRIATSLRKAGHDPTDPMTYESDPDAAQLTVQRQPPFQLAIVDLIWVENDVKQEQGIEVVKALRERSPDTVIVALTIGDPQIPDLEDQAKAAGADIFVERKRLTPRDRTYGYESFEREIVDALAQRGLLPAHTSLSYDRDDPGIVSIVTDVGEPMLLRLLWRLLGEAAGLRAVALQYVAPGASGAHVLGATATIQGEATRHYLVKLGRDKRLLSTELANYAKTLGTYSTLFPRYFPDARPGPVMVGDWYAIGADFVSSVRTLRSWVVDAGPGVEQVLRSLFLEGGLSDGYGENLAGDPNESAIHGLQLPSYRRLRVREAIDRLRPALLALDSVDAGERDEILRVVANFTRNGDVERTSARDLPRGPFTVQAHGDLHGGNVLVTRGEAPRAVVVDIANLGKNHWAADVARLFVDLVSRSLDAGAESFFWDRLAAWREYALAASDGASLPSLGSSAVPTDPSADNARVGEALTWLVARRAEIWPSIGPERRWEWHVALAEQFARGTYQVEVTAPKRVLCLLCAYDQLRRACELLPERRDF